MPKRIGSLQAVLDSIVGQVDEMYVALNGYFDIDKLPCYDNVWYKVLDNSLSDAAKFYHVGKVNGYYISWDDDLIAPPNVVDKLIEGVDKYNGVVSFHGKMFLKPVVSYKRWAGNYRCLSNVSNDVKVNLIGSGCTCFHTDRLKLSITDFKSPNKADVWLSKASADQGVPMIVLAHSMGYLKYIAPPSGTTIWETTRDYSEHVAIMRTFIK